MYTNIADVPQIVMDALDFDWANRAFNDTNTLPRLRAEARQILSRLNKTRPATTTATRRYARVRARRSQSSLRRARSDSGGVDTDPEPEPKHRSLVGCGAAGKTMPQPFSTIPIDSSLPAHGGAI